MARSAARAAATPARSWAISLATGLHQGPAHLAQDERAPVQPGESLVVEVDQQAAGGAAEQRVGIRDDGNRHLDSAREDLAVEIGAERSEGAAATRLFAALPREQG